MTNRKLWILCLPALLFAGALQAQGQALFEKTHGGAKESKVASDWYTKLPTWAATLTSRNQFIETWLMLDGNFKPSQTPNRFMIRDANKNDFNAFEMIRDGVDTDGRAVYKVTKSSKWIPWKGWQAKYIVSSYPVETNTDPKDLVAFAAWLFGEKENDLANRVLTYVHERERDWAPLIEQYLAEKNNWKEPGELVRWDLWDSEFHKKRAILIPASMEASRTTAREKAAADAFKELERSRGDYKGKPPRRNKPTKLLIFVEWEIKQFRIQFAGSKFIEDKKNADKLADMERSVRDDMDLMKDGLERANSIPKSSDDVKGIEAKLNLMEQYLALDPMSLHLRSQIGNEWYAFAKTDEYGNDCQRPAAARKAIEHYKILVDAYPQNLPYLTAMAKCYQALQESKQAGPLYDKVIEIDGDGQWGRTAAALKRNMELKDEHRQRVKDRDNVGERR